MQRETKEFVIKIYVRKGNTMTEIQEIVSDTLDFELARFTKYEIYDRDSWIEVSIAEREKEESD
jgi:hypothetical protein